MKCPKCQVDNLESAKFCNECGNKLEPACPECGKMNPFGSKFCNDCGHSLLKPKDSPTVDYDQPQTYTPKHLAEKILTVRSAIEGERKVVTVLFADVANYTSISEKLDPEEVHQIMDGCFKILMNEIHKYEGTINQFTGDGVMALFGAPVAHEDHAQRACHAALSIQQGINKYSEKIVKDTGLKFKMRIGINSGPVIVGAIGDDLRMDYTAIGDTTNLGSRMESLADPGTVLVSENSHRLTRDFFEFNSLGKIEVKGKENPQEAFELIKTGKVETRIGASVAKGLTRFVGRKKSMATLLNAFETVKSGSGQVVGLVGEAGVGKSRLLLEMRHVLPEDKYTYLEGRCIHYGGAMPYLPMLDVLRSYFDIKEGDREFLISKKIKDKIVNLDETLEHSIPYFKDLLSLKIDDPELIKLDPKDKREKTFEALRSLIIRSSHEKPLILAIEDLHWIDKTSEEFIDYLIGGLANNPILLILLYRPEYTHQWGSKSYYSKVGLTQLGIPSSSELIKAILEDGEVAPELKQLILNRSAGNPLFMEEFTHTLLQNGAIERNNDLFVLSRKASEVEIPDTIQGIISARLDRLEENLKRTMQVASVIGRDFAFRILQTITGMRKELKSHLLNLQGLEFIYEKNLFPELEYIFKHALTQEVAYNSLLLNRRKEIHENIGKAIESLYPERLEEFYEMLAYHYSKSDNYKKSAYYFKLSGKKAEANYSHFEALNFYKSAFEEHKNSPNMLKTCESLLDLHSLMRNPINILGGPKGSIKILQEGVELAKEAANKKLLAMYYNDLSIIYTMRGNSLLAIENSEKSFNEAQQIEDIEAMIPVAVSLSYSYVTLCEYTKLINITSKSIEIIEKANCQNEFYNMPLNPYSYFLGYCGMIKGFCGDFKNGLVLCKKALRHAKKIRDSMTLSISELQLGNLLMIKGDGQSSLEHCKNGVRYSEEINWPLLLSQSLTYVGYSYCLLGDLVNARNFVERGIEIQNNSGIEALSSYLYWISASVYFDSSDFKSAQKSSEKALELSIKNNEMGYKGLAKVWLGRTLARIDSKNYNRAEELIYMGIELLDKVMMKPSVAQGYLFLGELYINTGKHDKAMLNLKNAHDMFKEMGMDYWLDKTQNLIEKS